MRRERKKKFACKARAVRRETPRETDACEANGRKGGARRATERRGNKDGGRSARVCRAPSARFGSEVAGGVQHVTPSKQKQRAREQVSASARAVSVDDGGVAPSKKEIIAELVNN